MPASRGVGMEDSLCPWLSQQPGAFDKAKQKTGRVAKGQKFGINNLPCTALLMAC